MQIKSATRYKIGPSRGDDGVGSELGDEVEDALAVTDGADPDVDAEGAEG